jgi:PAS domain-containing protein
MKLGATDYLSKDEVTAPLLERTIRYAVERKKIEEALLRAHEELEMRVQERTHELAQANSILIAEIYERRRAESALQTERKRLFSLLDELPAFVHLQAPDYSIRFANCNFQNQFGSPEGKTCYQLLHDRDRPCDICPTFSVFDNQAPIEWEWTLPDGLCYQVYDYPFTDVDGSPLVLELGIDITRRKQVEAQIEQSNRELMEVSLAEHNQRMLSD